MHGNVFIQRQIEDKTCTSYNLFSGLQYYQYNEDDLYLGFDV